MAKKKWPKIPGYTIPLFECANVYLALSKDQYTQADEFLGGTGKDMSFNSGLAGNYEHTESGERAYLIGVFDKNLSTLVHECAHVCFYACSDVGVTTNPSDANETYCYMLDRMFSFFSPFVAEAILAEENNGQIAP